jgi:V-type H+-transporting ATPase S1 subunit
LQANPYPKDAPSKSKVRATAAAAGETATFFTIPVLSALTVSLLFIVIMTWALENITSIKTMDQFDDPRGKTITVPLTD